AIAHEPIVFFRVDFRFVDALHAVGAFLHDSAAADSDIRVAQAVEAWSHPIGIKPEIKAAYFIGTVIGAIARADAAVVNHLVEAIVIVEGGADRAHHLAGRLLALHARDG